MFKYVDDISKIAHYIIEKFLENKNIAVDGTLGNGHDTDFLAERFKEVYAFDIQEKACTIYTQKNKKNVKVIHNSHDLIKEYVDKKVDCIMYNLGFLPGGNKNITTKSETSLESIRAGLDILNSGGIMTICLYRGHAEGKNEESVIMPFLKELPKNQFGVMEQTFLNRSEEAPVLVVIEKK